MSPTLWLELTPRCNLDCAFCYNPWRPGPKADHPPIAAYDEYEAGVGRLLDRLQFDYVALSGGEPLVYPHLRRLLAFVAGRGQSPTLTTNGRLASRKVVGELHAAGLKGLQVPLLSVDPRVHDELSGRRSWTQAVTAIALGLETGLATGVTFVATGRNAHELERVADLTAGLGVRSLVVNEVQDVGSAQHNGGLGVDPVDLRERVARARERTAASGMTIQFIGADGQVGAVDPASPWGRVAVSPSAELKLCNQSAATLGRIAAIGDRELDDLLAHLRAGAVSRYRPNVDNCTCFDVRVAA